MDIQEFEQVAKSGRRWTAKSLAIARAILVDQQKTNDVAQQFSVSPQHVNVLRTRFLKRAKDMYLCSYINRVEPDEKIYQLRKHKNQILILCRKGYSPRQIADYLDMLGVSVTVHEIKEFVKGLDL